MKYFTDTLKYIKSNPILWAAFVVAACCMAVIADVGAVHNVLNSFGNGSFSAGLTEWFCLFVPVNTSSWWAIIISLAAYILLALDLAMVCAATDRHMRYNSLSLKGMFSSLNNNILPCLCAALLMLVLFTVCAVMFAGIMKATCVSAVSGLYILGIILCVALALVIFYATTFFSLWLPCFIIAGFRAFESLSYSYSLGAQRRRPLFLSIFIPSLVIAAVSVPVMLFAPAAVSITVLSLLFAALFIYVAALVFVVYVDADGITREDLKKF